MSPDPITSALRESPAAKASIAGWRQVAVWMLLCGAALIELGLAFRLISTSTPGLVHATTALFVVLGLGTGFVTPRWFLWHTRFVVLASIVAITVLARAIDDIGTIPIYYVWPLLGAAYLLTRADVVVFSLLSIGGCALGTSPSSTLTTADYLSTAAVSFVVITTVRVLAEHLGATIRSLRRASSTDPLTGLLNRRALEQKVSEAMRLAAQDRKPSTVVVFDIDHFKLINDRFGHGTGDDALVRFAELLRASCRSSDLIARMGGEEFAVLMPGAPLELAAARAEQFADAVRRDRTIDGLTMTVSGGIATTGPGEITWDDLLTSADDAVYQAKHAGRDRIVVAAPASPRPRATQRSTAPTLRQAT